MPRKAKENVEEIKEKVVKSVKKANTTKKSSSGKAKSSIKTNVKSTTKATSSKAKTSVKKTTANKAVTKKTTTKNMKSKTSSSTKNTKKKIEIIEYYDLPYSYNQTIVRVLAQTPTTLFVYWDISDEDKENYIKQYGEYFFNNTKPVLVVHNITKNYSYEVDINDFANSWYLHVPDSSCDYEIEFGRRSVNEYVSIPNNYMYIAKSNDINSPNDHILFDELSQLVYFRNVKTNETIEKNIVNFTFIEKIHKINSLKALYKKMYPQEVIDFEKLDLRNPSSSNPTSSFK